MAIRYIQPVALNSTEGLVARVYPQIKKEFGALVEPFTLHSPLLKGLFKRMAGWFFSKAIHRSKPLGASLELFS